MILNFIRVLKHKYINIYQLNIHTFFLNILFVSLKTMIIFGVPPAIIQHHYVCLYVMFASNMYFRAIYINVFIYRILTIIDNRTGKIQIYSYEKVRENCDVLY